MQTPTIESKRIILRPLRVEDAQDIYERWTSDDRVSQYVRWSTHQSVEETIWWLQEEEKNNSGEDSYQWGFVDREKIFCLVVEDFRGMGRGFLNWDTILCTIIGTRGIPQRRQNVCCNLPERSYTSRSLLPGMQKKIRLPE